MNILVILVVFFIIATIIKIAVDNIVNIVKPFTDLKRYKLVIALVLTIFGVFGLNLGVLNALNIPFEVSRSWFHYFDLVLTVLFLTSGSQAIHKLDNAWKDYNTKKGE